MSLSGLMSLHFLALHMSGVLITIIFKSEVTTSRLTNQCAKRRYANLRQHVGNRKTHVSHIKDPKSIVCTKAAAGVKLKILMIKWLKCISRVNVCMHEQRAVCRVLTDGELERSVSQHANLGSASFSKGKPTSRYTFIPKSDSPGPIYDICTPLGEDCPPSLPSRPSCVA